MGSYKQRDLGSWTGVQNARTGGTPADAADPEFFAKMVFGDGSTHWSRPK